MQKGTGGMSDGTFKGTWFETSLKYEIIPLVTTMTLNLTRLTL